MTVVSPQRGFLYWEDVSKLTLLFGVCGSHGMYTVNRLLGSR